MRLAFMLLWMPNCTCFCMQALGFLATAPPPSGERQLPGGVREPLLPPVSQNMSYRIADHALV